MKTIFSFFFLYVCWIMGIGKNLTNAKKQKIAKFLSPGMFTLETWKDLHEHHWMIKSTVENITRNKRKGFKNLSLQGLCKLEL